MQRPYNDPEYRAARAWLRTHPTPCWECGQPAVTPDHDPPLADHTHLRGSGCCQLRPHCRTCSNRQGAGITNTTQASDRDTERIETARRWRR